jgi:hypothetical protein
MGTLILAATIP